VTTKTQGEAIQFEAGKLTVPSHPIIPFIEGDGTGVDIWPAAQRAFDAAVEKAYGGERSIAWKEVLAGQKAKDSTGEWLPNDTIEAFKQYYVGIKGPLTTPVGGGIRSLNVALRQVLDLYVCLRPVKYIKGVPSPVKNPDEVDMVIFRENSEDIYAGIEFENGTDECEKFKKVFADNFPEQYKKIRFPDTSGIGIKPISQEGTHRLVKAAIESAIQRGRQSVTLVHKGNIMKFTEGAFRDWGYELARTEYHADDLDGGPWQVFKLKDVSRVDSVSGDTAGKASDAPEEIVVKDVIADAFLQQILTRPKEYDVIATMNLNGDYISDALAAQVGGIGIAPGGNINYQTGHAVFEATHGTAPKYAGQDKVNPGSLILSGELMLRHLGWHEAADRLIEGMEGAIAARMVTYDFARLMDNASQVSCSQFAEEMVKHMG